MDSERTDLLAKLDAQREALLAGLDGLIEASAAKQPSPGAWSAKQQLAHLARAERMYAACANRVRCEQEPDLSVHWAQNREDDPVVTNARPLAELLADLASAREATKRAIEQTSDEEFGRLGHHTPFGDMTIAQLFRSLYRHDRMHIDQIAGREPAYQPRVIDPSNS